ncbi:MAG TPA: hypothetical protein IAA38_08115, partial [Candidatus Ruminococcus gallistercoris]|nr:hypothetical protein [Candidatus Ruminococcus gallistercoris]
PDKTAPSPKAAKNATRRRRLSPGCAYFPHTIHILNSHIVFKQGATFWENALTLRPVHDTIGVRR